MARDYPDSFAPEPIDRVASRVISKGVHHEFGNNDPTREVWDTPPEVVPLFQVPETVRALFGTRKGRMVCVGYMGRSRTTGGNQKRQRLLVRCDCGRYETRCAGRWRRPNADPHYGCYSCHKKEFIKKQHLSEAERDRLEDLERKRQGLPSRQEAEAANRNRTNEAWERQLEQRLFPRTQRLSRIGEHRFTEKECER